MGQGEGLIVHDNIQDESLYYDDHLHLIEPGNAKFALNISNTFNNFNELKFNLQLKSVKTTFNKTTTYIYLKVTTNNFTF